MTAAPLLHLADRVLNRPLLLEPAKAAMIADVLAGRIGLDAGPAVAADPALSRFAGRQRRPDGGYGLNPVDRGVAVVSVVGSLVNRGAFIGASSGLVSYEGLAAQLGEAAERADVHAVILDLDSGGGEASGVVSLGRQLRALRGRKRVVAVVNDTACSAAYWLAAQASEIVVSETSSVGSIGALVLHIDRSGELEQKGLAPTLIHAGAHKVDGHPFAALPDEVRADWQARLDELVGLFAREVAAGRGERLTAAAARATEARVYYGRAAVKAGLADRVGTFAAVLDELTGAKPRKPPQKPASASRAGVTGPRPSATPAQREAAHVRVYDLPAASTPKPPRESAAEAEARRQRVIARVTKGS